MANETMLDRLILNKMTSDQYKSAKEAGTLSDTELYLVDDGGDAGFIPAPTTAKVGQTIKVSAIDASGKPTAWEAADFPSGGGSGGGDSADEYVVIFDKTFEANVTNVDPWGGEYFMHGYRHFWTTDLNGNNLEVDAFRVHIHVPAQSADIVNSGELKFYVGKGRPSNWTAYLDQQQPYFGFASFIGPGGKKVWFSCDYDLRTQIAKSQKVEGKEINGNFMGTYESVSPAFAQAIKNNSWQYWNGIELDLVSGGLPAGTRIFIYARKLNEAKVAERPR